MGKERKFFNLGGRGNSITNAVERSEEPQKIRNAGLPIKGGRGWKTEKQEKCARAKSAC